ncbi:MAG: cupin domain-containing protein [Acidobacteria bacterium]|nr:cupin domain-containing protein [Acidobacteriota bacterium]
MSIENHKNNSHLALSSLLIKLSAIKQDPALAPSARGARKLLITELFNEKENLAQEEIWQAPKIGEKCSVLLTKDFEMSVFNQTASQDRHYHKIATEIYLVIEGSMLIEVEKKDHLLFLGDSIVVNPGSVHLVKPNQEKFLCYVFALNCKGIEDKFVIK